MNFLFLQILEGCGPSEVSGDNRHNSELFGKIDAQIYETCAYAKKTEAIALILEISLSFNLPAIGTDRPVDSATSAML